MTDLSLAELDLAVAKAEGAETPYLRRSTRECVVGDHEHPYFPTTNPNHAMKLLEKYRLRVEPNYTGLAPGAWLCSYAKDKWVGGDTPAIAICRAVVALKEKV